MTLCSQLQPYLTPSDLFRRDMAQSLSIVTATLAAAPLPSGPVIAPPTTKTQPTNLTIGTTTESQPPGPSTDNMPTVSLGFPNVTPLDEPSGQSATTKENFNGPDGSTSSSGSSNSKTGLVEDGTFILQTRTTTPGVSSPTALGNLSVLQTPSVTSSPSTSVIGQEETSSVSSPNGSRPQKQHSTSVLGALIGTLLLTMAVD
ncbi:hypothetical protein DL96DRAFT_1687535 [Flagelloscypha sp. PMI_526]|nr:hypothetical protein DL96DRAFT_1687535 [Flagelloscypha sp. PMI_526]